MDPSIERYINTVCVCVCMYVCVPRLYRQSPFRMSNSITLLGRRQLLDGLRHGPRPQVCWAHFNYKFSIKIFPLAFVVAFIVFDICPRCTCKKERARRRESPLICHLLQNNRARAWPGTAHAVTECV